MAWDAAKPVGSNPISQGDDDIRSNNTALETAIGAEHEFSTGGANSGRHKFAIGDETTIEALADAVDGSVGLVNDARTGNLVWAVRRSSVWEYLDVYQPTTLPRLDEQSEFTTCQFATFETVAPVSDQVTIDLATSPYKQTTIIDNTLILNPTNAVAGAGTTIHLEVTQDGTGGRSLTWGNLYVAVGDAAPPIATGPNETTILTITATSAGTYLVRSEPNPGGPI